MFIIYVMLLLSLALLTSITFPADVPADTEQSAIHILLRQVLDQVWSQTMRAT